MKRLNTTIAALAIATALSPTIQPAAAASFYTVNGLPAPMDVQVFLYRNGFPPGDYWLNSQGDWGVVGDVNARGNIYGYAYATPHGSGERASNGWSHYDNTTGMGVGGDSNGCLYAGDWSNC